MERKESHLKQDKVLAFENEINDLKLEIDTLKSKDENKKYVKLEKENHLLKRQKEELAAENMNLLNKQQQQQQKRQQLQTENRITELEAQVTLLHQNQGLVQLVKIRLSDFFSSFREMVVKLIVDLIFLWTNHNWIYFGGWHMVYKCYYDLY